MTEPCDITVVVPLYNKAPFITRCLASIAAQSVQPAEVVVVDDGLTIRIIAQPNAGVNAARDAGVAAATTPWVAFLDADDEYLPGAIKGFMTARNAVLDAEVVFGRSVSVDDATALARPADKGAPDCVRVPDYFAYFLLPQGVEANS